MFLRKVFSFATLTLLVALTLSSIAAWYSIQGLMAIFAAAVVPIMIMGGSLEFAKVVTTLWLHKYWNRASWKLKLYLIPAVIALAFLTSMGIFGFLSKAHSDQSLVSGDVGAKIAVYDTKIQTAKENIESNRKALTQMDAQVDQLLGRTTDDKGANRAVQVRRQQKAERTRLQNEIVAEQEVITKLQDEAAPIRAEVRKVEAEVGPIKYIAAMIYGDNPDSNLLERAVRWVIVLIVFVFDPLALTLVLAAQSSYKWLEEDLKKQDEDEFVDAFLNSKGSIDPQIDLGLDDLDEEIENDETLLPTDVVSIDDGVGETLQQEHIPDAIEPVVELEPSEAEPTQQAEPTETVEIQTEGVTLHESENGYIQYEGKSMSKEALKGMYPQLFARPDIGHKSETKFGTEFPRFADKGDIFVRIDVLPNRVYKFDGFKWIEINKDSTDSYLFDDQYVNYLVGKIESGEYDVELLSDSEKEQIADYIQRNQK
jgi:hypothetical protein